MWTGVNDRVVWGFDYVGTEVRPAGRGGRIQSANFGGRAAAATASPEFVAGQGGAALEVRAL